MKLKLTSLAVLLVVCLLTACSKKPAEDANSANPQTQSGSSNTTSQATPPPAPAAAPQPAPEAPPKPIVVPAGTVLTVRLQQALSSKTSNQGDPFNATLAEPVLVGGKTVIPAGSSVSGTVTEAHQAGRFKGGATLNLVLSAVTVGPKTYQISTTTMSQTSKGKGKRTAGMIAGGGGAGALIGGLAGGGKGAGIGALLGAGAGTAGAAFTGDRDITMPAESAASFKLTSSLSLPPRGNSQQ